MTNDDQYDDVMRALMSELDNMREHGLIEVVGINEKGDWLYSSTALGTKMLQELSESKEEDHDAIYKKYLPNLFD